MPPHVIPLATVSVLTSSPAPAPSTSNRPPPQWTPAPAPAAGPASRGGSLLASLAQSSPLTWFTCGLTALVGPRSRRGITQQITPPSSHVAVVVDTQPGHTVVSPPLSLHLPTVPAPPPAITIDSSSPPRHSSPRHLPQSPVSCEISIPGPQPAPAAPAPTTRKPASSSRWISLSRLFQSLSAIRLPSPSLSRPTPTHLSVPTHFRGRRSRSQSLHRSPTASSFSHSSFSSTTTSTPPPGTPPVKPHAMLLPDSPLDREYAQWCAARDARGWIVLALAEIGVDPQAPAGVSSTAVEAEFARVPPASPMSTQSFQSAGGANATISEGLVQCVLHGGVEVDVASALAAPVDALKAVVARFAGVAVENVSADSEGAEPVGFVAGREGQAGQLPELAVVAVREVYHALKALRSPPPMYSAMAVGEAIP